MTTARYIVRQMLDWGVDTVFGVPGDTLLPFLEEVRHKEAMNRLRFIVCRHEGAAALMASAYAKVTGKMAVCVADSGPGAVQLMNGVYDAALDRVPMLVITGELPTRRRGGHWPQRADLERLYGEAAAFNETVVDGKDAPRLFVQALRRALLRNRPVRIGVPKNIWHEPVANARLVERPRQFGGRVLADDDVIEQAARMLESSERPVLFAGLGVRDAIQPLLHLAEQIGAPVVHSMPALGMLPPEHRWNLGVIGKFGTEAAAAVLGRADTIVAVGTTWWQPEFVADDATVIQIDRERDHLGLTFPVDVGVWGTATDVLPRLARAVTSPPRTDWSRFVAGAKQRLEEEVQHMATRHDTPLEPGAVMAAVGGALVDDALVSIDVGNNTFWFSRYHRKHPFQLVMSGHWRTVGFGLPGGIAAKLAAPERQVVVVCGDGGFAMSMNELTTAVQYELPLVCVILRDGRYGEEESLQKETGRTPFATGFHNADWAAYARACGAAGYTVETYEDLQAALHEALPRLAEGQVSVLDVAVGRVDPQHAPPHAAAPRAREAVPVG